MVKVFKHTHRYDDPPLTVLLAFYLRYPNPFASHVLSCDVISRTFNPATGGMRTTRLLLKRGIIPKWARTWLGGLGGMEAWVMEESEVVFEGEQPRLVSTTKNISHKKIMTVIEGTDLVYAGLNRGTLHKTTAHIVSDFGGSLGSLVRGQIESWGAGRFEGNAETASRPRSGPFRVSLNLRTQARQGMSLILSLLRSSQPLPQTSESQAQIARSEWEAKYSYKARGPSAAGSAASGETETEGSTDTEPQDLLQEARRRAKGKQKASDDDVDGDDGVDGRGGAHAGVAAPHSFFLSSRGQRPAATGASAAQRSTTLRDVTPDSSTQDPPVQSDGTARIDEASTGWAGWWRGKG